MFYKKIKNSLRTGFEPAREYPIGFRVQRLNHSAIAAIYICSYTIIYIYIYKYILEI